MEQFCVFLTEVSLNFLHLSKHIDKNDNDNNDTILI